MKLHIRRARPDDSPECIRLRGLTRENAIPEESLRGYGITKDSWAADIKSGAVPGWVAYASIELAGYCFGASDTGEVVVLALRPEYEGQGLGKRLLDHVVQDLRTQGHARLFLGCSSDPQVRSWGFYRHLGWKSTATTDAHGNEVLELTSSTVAAPLKSKA